MLEYLPKEVRAGLELARKQAARKKSRLRLRQDEKSFAVLRSWEDGFALSIEDAPQLRGLVDLYDGARHVSQCLIVASVQEGDEMIYEFKRNTAASKTPPIDYERDENAPVALIGRG